MTRIDSVGSFSRIYLDEHQYLFVIKCDMPNSLSEDMIELGEKYMLSPDDPQVVTPNGEPQHDNLQRLEGRTGWHLQKTQEYVDIIKPRLDPILSGGVVSINASEHPHKYVYAMVDLWVGFYKEDSHVSKHNHDDAWDSLAFAWYLDTPEDGTYLEFVTGRNYGKRIHVQKNQLLLFNGRLNHQFYGNAAKRIVCSGNLIFANERFYKPNVEVENKNVNMEQAKISYY